MFVKDHLEQMGGLFAAKLVKLINTRLEPYLQNDQILISFAYIDDFVVKQSWEDVENIFVNKLKESTIETLAGLQKGSVRNTTFQSIALIKQTMI
uniref:Uncharacterized protein n=1 Tax=Caenorhabditis japonica TaxID=281687 RepID=A0A8R1DQ40_CAEJA